MKKTQTQQTFIKSLGQQMLLRAKLTVQDFDLLGKYTHPIVVPFFTM